MDSGLSIYQNEGNWTFPIGEQVYLSYEAVPHRILVSPPVSLGLLGLLNLKLLRLGWGWAKGVWGLRVCGWGLTIFGITNKVMDVITA